MIGARWTIDIAGESDCPDVLGLLLARAEWLRSIGSDQWANFAETQDRLTRIISAGRTWLLRDDASGAPLGTITFTDTDPDFWTAEEQAVPSMYLAKLATDPAAAGMGLGRLLLDFAMYRAVAAQTIEEVRFDVWKTASDLQKYYVRLGWTYLRTVEVPGRNSGALFSRPVIPPLVNKPPCGLIIGKPSAFGTPKLKTTREPGEREHGGF